MERNGFNTPHFETSGDEPDDSKEKSKTKKKKSAEAVPAQSAEKAKKETVADRGKSLWEKLVGDDKDKEPTAKPETSVESKTDQIEAAAETGDENDPGLEEMTPEEDAEVTRNLVEGKLAELEVERDESEAPEEVVGIDAAIAMLEEMRADVVEASEAAVDEDAETGPSEQPAEPAVLESAEAEPAAFDDEQTIPINKQPPKTSATESAGSGSSRSSSGGAPPMTPTPSRGSQPGGAGPMPDLSSSVLNFNQAPSLRTQEYSPDYRVNPNATYLLVGGVVGYLIGRRRGRIKTEKRLAVVQRKLEKQVEAKQQEINAKTEQVKKLARQNYEQSKSKPPLTAQRVMESASASVRQQAFESTPGKRPSLARPTPETAPAEMQKAKHTEKMEARVEKGVELTDEDIERLSETITIGATNLRKIHEAKLITDGGLRRLVNEHLQGKDIRRGLAREFLTKELSYERDPRFRDIVPLAAKGAPPQASSSPTADVQDEPVALTTSEPAELNIPQSVAPARAPKNRRTNVSTGVLSVLSLVALALAVYAVWLGMSR